MGRLSGLMRAGLSVLAAVCVIETAASDVMSFGVQKQLMVDDHVVASKSNITRELGRVEKLGPVLGPDLPTDFATYEGNCNPWFAMRLTVLWNEPDQKYQMWYRAGGEEYTGYAESENGIDWIKPKISADGQSNLISFRGADYGTFFEAAVMIDPTVPWGHPEKYKAAYNPGNTMCAIGYSSDGINWHGYNDGNSVTGRAADTFNQIIWDPIAGRYMLITRSDLGAEGGEAEYRAARIMFHADNDLMGNPEAWVDPVFVSVDDPAQETNPGGAPVLQMESMNIWVYENIYFGLMHVFTIASGEIPVGDFRARPDSNVIDYYMGTSRDGMDFDRSWIYVRKPFVERGGYDEFDKTTVWPSSQIITQGDEHLIYYTAGYSLFTDTSWENGSVGLAKLPLDRFICLEAGSQAGTVVTKPFIAEGDKLEVNVKAESGSVQIELLDASDNVISGYTAAHSGVDELRLIPAWGGGGTIESLKGDTVKIKFTLTDARLYAFAQVGTSFKLTSAKSRIAAGADTELSIERIGGLTGSVTWSASGGAISSENDSGAVFTSDGTIGTATVTAVVGEITKTVDIEIFDPAEYNVQINCGGGAVGDWVSDGGFVSGGESYNWEESIDVSGVENAGPAQIYETVRHTSPHSYTFPVVDGDYIVRIHFVDRMTSLHRDVTYNIEGTAVESGISIPEGPEVREYNVTVSDGNGLTIECVGNGESDVFEAGIEVTYAGGSATESYMAGFGSGIEGLRIHEISGGKYRISALSGKEPFSARIVSVNGTVVESFSGRGSGIWAPKCASGIYFVDVVFGGRQLRQKVLVHR